MILHLARLRAGAPDRLPLILLHGFTGDSSTWSPLLPHLPIERTIIAIDLPGHGGSPKPRDPAAYTMPAALAALIETLDEHGIARAHWLGYSMGGRVALNLAVAAPGRIASLILVGSSPGLTDPADRAARRREDETLAEGLEAHEEVEDNEGDGGDGDNGITAFVDRWMASPLFATQARLGPDFLATARQQRLRNAPHAMALTLRGMGVGTVLPVADRLGEIEAPVLVVAGSEDAKFVQIGQAMVSALGAGRLAIIEGSGHAVHLEAPEVLGAAVEAFLAGPAVG